ncbi:MAG: methyltransferase domain-containing protein [Flavobacteriaceae bacterium]|nr:methyltransferase domain-containing protein [Flavobacteriaceae bacterium]
MEYNHPLPELEPKVLAVKLSAVGERSVRSEHPWIFSDSIEKLNKEGHPGDVCVIFSHTKNKPLGIGLFDPKSPIRIKMLHFGGGAKLDSSFFEAKIHKAYALRLELLETDTNSYRLIFGENDGFPGLIADVYAEVLVLKLYSDIWLPYLKLILPILIETSKAKTVVLRLSRNLQRLKLALTDGMVIYGLLENETVLFKEHGIQFSANVIKGHKTGYFLDHRENRRQVGRMAKNKTVLDVFAYAGGFSIHALMGGAREVTSLDISAQALEVAKENAALNTYTGKHLTIVGDAFTEMERLISEGKKYEIVVIDPPSFAKKASEVEVAKKKYTQLAYLGIALTKKGGMLVLASCSSRVRADEFFEINAKALNECGRKFDTKNRTQHDIDHPVGFTEGAYLKCGYYKLD